ncbi:acyl-CoA synthetase (AMP-forming)/AMP-acid ligase II [Microbacterium ginsengiterrae]|uniref:Acyl-CoA synthetase (AMP-forming)/AMP-acid ligase II n=1 Tax=Microbacterium ginsengiterrae TaxID=546115 RepID=A0A7W9CD89_9MICO|nr:class I adenylate-forming enzyme family protein [Microbacterium ginsengiterrae]MBB5743358.1 acyl-CoA synthetase (AMP-forming)/AMP-acid ligase II [Microbacterium ginsengiterrae]
MNTARYLLGTGQDTAPAFVDDDTTYTYRELRSAVATLGSRLEDLRLPPGFPVALAGPNSFFWVAAYLAIMAAGLVCVPMPAALTPEEFRSRLQWVGCRAVMFSGPERRRHTLAPEIAVLGDELLEQQASVPFEIRDVDPDGDAAYLFTSGTTAAPRVVRITHRNIQANTDSILGYVGLTEEDRMLVVLPFSYVFGASLLHTHLRAGACLVNQPSCVYLEAVVNRLAGQRCTGIAGVPSNFHALMRNSSFRSRDLPDLRLIQQAGGRMSPTIIDEIRTAHPRARLFVMYGQTEATARLSYLPPEDLDRRPGSIGRGLPGVTLRVVDREGRDVAPGEIGEIWASGDNVSPGYLFDARRTAEKMPGGVLHTGDLATRDADGYIYVVDRAEDFIKSWGHRIASQDVETAVMELPEVISVAAVGVPDAVAGESVAVAVVMRPDADADAARLTAHCRARLPKHMVPERVAFVDRLPLNSSGKVVKREVRAWFHPETVESSVPAGAR